MKISLAWLKRYLETFPSFEVLADKLTMGGLVTENFEHLANGDVVMDVEVTSNRADCLSYVGVARELGALLNLSATPPAIPAPRVMADVKVLVRIEDERCSFYSARVITGVKVGPSPAWLVIALESMGLRSVNNVVDITNFVMFELGQPLHAFDLRKVGGGEIVVRTAKAGEKLVSLDGHTRSLDPSMMVIADAASPSAIAGIMGGKESEVTEQTVDLLIESAVFDPLCVRKTARTLGLRSDSTYRFERGLDQSRTVAASDRCVNLIMDAAGGMAGPLVQAGVVKSQTRHLTLRLARLKQVTGMEITPAEAVDAFKRLRFSPKLVGGAVEVTIPSDRLDVNLEIDLVEEVARIVGYEKIPQREDVSIRLKAPARATRAVQLIRTVLTGSGLYEGVTFSFVTDAIATDFQPSAAAKLLTADPAVRKADARLRPSLVPGLLESLQRNHAVGNASADGGGGVGLFEVGSRFWADAVGKPVEKQAVTLAVPTLAEARGTVEQLLAQLDSTRVVSVKPAAVPGYSEAGEVFWGTESVGTVGLVAPAVLGKIGMKQSAAAAELDLPLLIAGTKLVPTLKPLPKYPATERDLSLVVAESLRYEAIEGLITKLGLANLESARFVTTYRGKPLEKGQKSVTTALVFRSPTGTLTGDEVDAAVNKVVEAAKAQLGAVLRT